jgi:hypothetical protein
MDGSSQNSYERNQLTLGLNLAGYTNVVLSFWVKGFLDEPNGPPPTPFSTGADFDGVAISQDGVAWYEVQGLRNLSTSYVQYTVNLDAAVAAFGLAYNSTFRIRFNQYDNYPIQASNSDGIGLDDIAVTGSLPGALHHFNLTAVPTPQLVDAPFPVTITAVDAVNSLVSGFTGTVNLWGVLGSNSSPSSTMLGNLSWQVGANGPAAGAGRRSHDHWPAPSDVSRRRRAGSTGWRRSGCWRSIAARPRVRNCRSLFRRMKNACSTGCHRRRRVGAEWCRHLGVDQCQRLHRRHHHQCRHVVAGQ